MTRYYDEVGKRVPSPRGKETIPNGITVLMICVAIVAIVIAFWMSIVATRQGREIEALNTKLEAKQREDKLNDLVSMDAMCGIHTTDGDVIRLYVLKDPDRGVEYVVSSKGGVCPRVENSEE